VRLVRFSPHISPVSCRARRWLKASWIASSKAPVQANNSSPMSPWQNLRPVSEPRSSSSFPFLSFPTGHFFCTVGDLSLLVPVYYCLDATGPPLANWPVQSARSTTDSPTWLRASHRGPRRRLPRLPLPFTPQRDFGTSTALSVSCPLLIHPPGAGQNCLDSYGSQRLYQSLHPPCISGCYAHTGPSTSGSRCSSDRPPGFICSTHTPPAHE
jgi:hypothetical protein